MDDDNVYLSAESVSSHDNSQSDEEVVLLDFDDFIIDNFLALDEAHSFAPLAAAMVDHSAEYLHSLYRLCIKTELATLETAQQVASYLSWTTTLTDLIFDASGDNEPDVDARQFVDLWLTALTRNAATPIKKLVVDQHTVSPAVLCDFVETKLTSGVVQIDGNRQEHVDRLDEYLSLPIPSMIVILYSAFNERMLGRMRSLLPSATLLQELKVDFSWNR